MVGNFESSVFVSLETRIREGSRCSDCRSFASWDDTGSILEPLGSLKGDYSATDTLRRIFGWFQEGVHRLDDDEVAAGIAGLVARRQLHICKVRYEQRRSVVNEPAQRREEPGPSSAPRPAGGSAPETPTFDPDHSAAAQAAALQSGAEAGVPFCEVCQRGGA